MVEVSMNELGQTYVGQVIVLELGGDRFMVIQSMGPEGAWDEAQFVEILDTLRFLEP
jgi:hypothetical protein